MILGLVEESESLNLSTLPDEQIFILHIALDCQRPPANLPGGA